MKTIKKVMYIIFLTIVSLLLYVTVVKATTEVTVTADTLNVREKASTSSEIVATLSQGVKCELIEESGDWYKVKYKTYIGYVAKEYVKKNENNNETTDNNPNDNENATNQDTNQTIPDTNNNDDSVVTQSTGKISAKTDVRIVPLIYSSKLEQLEKGTSVTILSEMNGWSYIQTDTITGWVRRDIIAERKDSSGSTVDKQDNTTSGDNKDSNNNNSNNNASSSNNSSSNNSNNSTTTSVEEKTVYVNESSVNLRKEPNTSSKIMMVVGLNQKLTVIGESGDWYQIRTSEGNAYVLKTLVSTKQTTTSRGNSLIHTSDASNNNAEAQVKTTSNVTAKTTNQVKTNTTKSTTTTSSSRVTKGKEVVAYAEQFLGVPYVYGGASKSGFDCSGFTMYVYKKFGISMGHGAKMQSKLGKAIHTDKTSASSLKNNLQAGDLVFFLDYETMDEIGHCGIYIGDGKFIHASSGSGYCVKINSLLPGEYYNTRFCAARRVL